MIENSEMNISRFVQSADGTEIYADATGNRSPGAPVLVLIHGAFMVKGAFNPIFEDPKWTSSIFLVSLAGILDCIEAHHSHRCDTIAVDTVEAASLRQKNSGSPKGFRKISKPFAENSK
jgi:hypothetical protein